MISYGSQMCSALMPYSARSHQLGKGQRIDALISLGIHPSRLVYGSRFRYAAMSFGGRSHQLGEGHKSVSGMPRCARPPQLVLESRHDCAVMPMEDRSQEEGQRRPTAMSRGLHPPQLVSRRPINRYRNVTPTPPPEGRVKPTAQQCQAGSALPHQFTRGHKQDAAMPRGKRLSREGSFV